MAAVAPGVSVSVNTVLSDLERQPGEFVTDPWVAERTTLAAEQREHLVAAAHLLRYRADAEVGESYRGAAEINWFVHRPAASLWPDADRAADRLMRACLACFARWNVRVLPQALGFARAGAPIADGALPAPLVYGVPRPWPHVRAVYERAGFRHVGDTEVILIARVDDLPAHEPRPGVTVERTLGACGTRFTARADGHALGFIEVGTALARPERHTRAAGLADIGNLHIDPARHGTGLERRLLAQAADRLRLCGIDRLAAYEGAADTAMLGLLAEAGFRELTRTDRGWQHRSG